MTLKIAVLAPIPRASVATATEVNKGARSSRRVTRRRREVMCTVQLDAGLPGSVRRSLHVRIPDPCRELGSLLAVRMVSELAYLLNQDSGTAIYVSLKSLES